MNATSKILQTMRPDVDYTKESLAALTGYAPNIVADCIRELARGGLVNVNGEAYKRYARIKTVQTKQWELGV